MKTYQKPELFYESFELSQHIASCELQVSFNLGNGTCNASGFLDGERVDNAFIDGDTACSAAFEYYCYTNSVAISHTHAS